MNEFLKIVAEDFYARIGNDLSRVVVVFPNKRAGLFFNEYLAQEADSPVWSPAYTTISELLQSFSPLKLGDPIGLICELYKAFREETQNSEPLDDFYFWGELLINDFDDVDKNLVQADMLFSNLRDLKNLMDGFEYLDKEQEAAIQQFFQNFSIERRTELKERFISLWDKLGAIYENFQSKLSAQGIGYEGMICRDAIARLDTDKLPFEIYVFVGFNVLNKVEYRLFEVLQQAGRALFYWDYDVFYTQMPHVKHEAGLYMNRNLVNFPSSLGEEYFNNLQKPKKISFISSPTENAQARYLPQWYDSVHAERERENAVVLCNESLLLPLLHAIPEKVENINITMGFPLSQTPSYTFVDALLELQTTGYNKESGRYTHAAVQAVLKHPYTCALSGYAGLLERELTGTNRFYPLPSELKKDEILAKIFSPVDSIAALCSYITGLLKDVAALYNNKEEENEVFNQLYKESLFKSYTIINRMLSLVENGELPIQQDTFKRLIHSLLLSVNIPFHGEPAMGLQVMGVLETRNLDFKNLIVMSLNEGLLPQTGGESSFIPYSLRKAFGMTTIEHRDAIYSYYFYRMIQRAENITLLYNTSSDGLNRGEPSRYILQLLVEYPHPIIQEFLQAEQSPRIFSGISIRKTPEVMERLTNSYSVSKHSKAYLSPSALNTYLDCTLKFYYRYVARLKEQEEVNTGIDSSKFGSIFHRSMELIYSRLTETGNTIRKEDLERILKEERIIRTCVDAAFKELFFHVSPDTEPEYNGTQLINYQVILTYVKQLLRNDMRYAPFEIVATEKEVSEVLQISTAIGKTEIRIGGNIDRIDRKNDTLRIIDYKTGGTPKSLTDIEALFVPAESRPGYIFQTFLYAAIMSRQQSLKVSPALLYIHRASSETYSPVIEMGEARKPKVPIDDFSVIEEDFRERLQHLLEEIYNEEIPFNQTSTNNKTCGYCEFRALCGK